MKIKTLVQSTFFLALLSCAAFYLITSNQGIRTYQTLMKEYNQEKAQVETLEKNISDIKQNIDSWQTNSIERERIARQDLGMSFTNELVYIIPQK